MGTGVDLSIHLLNIIICQILPEWRRLPLEHVEESGFHSIRPPRKPTENLIMNVGHYGGLHQPYRTEDLISLELKSVEAAVKLAKSVNIVQEDAYIAVRDILPDKDFVDGNGNTISGRSWRQPWSGFYTGARSRYCYL